MISSIIISLALGVATWYISLWLSWAEVIDTETGNYIAIFVTIANIILRIKNHLRSN